MSNGHLRQEACGTSYLPGQLDAGISGVLEQSNGFELELFGAIRARCHGSPPLGFIVPNLVSTKSRLSQGHTNLNSRYV